MVGEGKNKRGNGSGGKRMLRVEFILAEGGGGARSGGETTTEVFSLALFGAACEQK
jgi:hypothetical protein